MNQISSPGLAAPDGITLLCVAQPAPGGEGTSAPRARHGATQSCLRLVRLLFVRGYWGLLFCHNWLNTGYVCLGRIPLGWCCFLAGAASLVTATLEPGRSEWRGDGLQGMALGCISPPTHTQQGLQLRPEVLIQPTVNEGVVASAAHGKPVESKVQSIAAVDGPAGDQHHVAVQREPAHCKHNHHHHQHLQCHLLLPLMGIVLLHGDVPNGISQPELLCHHGVGNGDDKQG